MGLVLDLNLILEVKAAWLIHLEHNHCRMSTQRLIKAAAFSEDIEEVTNLTILITLVVLVLEIPVTIITKVTCSVVEDPLKSLIEEVYLID